MIRSRASAISIAVLAGCVFRWMPLRTCRRNGGERVRRRIMKTAPTPPRRQRPKRTKASALGECSAKFAGRRKPGGGYTYFDFMQNRHFDIAGPNPTPEEQKQIDEQYIVYPRRSAPQRHLGRVCGETAAGAAENDVANRARETAAATGASETASADQRPQIARKIKRLRQAFILMRLATAVRRHQGHQRKTVRRLTRQGKRRLSPQILAKRGPALGDACLTDPSPPCSPFHAIRISSCNEVWEQLRLFLSISRCPNILL